MSYDSVILQQPFNFFFTVIDDDFWNEAIEGFLEIVPLAQNRDP